MWICPCCVVSHVKGRWQFFTHETKIESMDTILDEMAMATVAEIQFRVVRIVSKRCSEALNHIPDISGQYRYTNKPPPTEPSPFIAKIFQPYTEFIQQNTTWIDTDKQDLWGRLIAENVVNRYMTSISDLLTSLRKMENSLKKIKKSKKSSQSTSLLNQQSGRTMSDEDKIRLQILLDVRQLGQEVMKREHGLKVFILIFPHPLVIISFHRQAIFQVVWQIV